MTAGFRYCWRTSRYRVLAWMWLYWKTVRYRSTAIFRLVALVDTASAYPADNFQGNGGVSAHVINDDLPNDLI